MLPMPISSAASADKGSTSDDVPARVAPDDLMKKRRSMLNSC